MKRIYLVLLAIVCLVCGEARAQGAIVPDTVVKHDSLDEVVVTGKAQRLSPGVVSVNPSKEQKRIANDGYRLLQQLDIPQINVDHHNFSVSTMTGSNVSLFINFMPATSMDVKALKTSDVTSVKYYEYPSDTRFNGATYAINFIVKERGGGYTKANLVQSFYGLNATSLSLFSKYKYKKMSYDLFVEWDYVNRHRGGSDTEEIFSLLNAENQPYTVTKTQNIQKFRNRNGGVPVSFRASYGTSNLRIVNTFGFNYHTTPANFSKGIISFSNDNSVTEEERNSNNARTRAYSWNGFYFFKPAPAWSLSVNTQVLYGHNNYNSEYSLIGNQPLYIANHSKENSFSGFLNASARYNASNVSSFSAIVFVADNNNNVDYTGSSNFTNDYNGLQTGGSLSYDAVLPINLRIHADAGLSWYRNSTNGIRDYNMQPSINLYASYALTQCHQFNLQATYNQNSIGASYKTSDVIQSNEVMYRTGNPLLKNVNRLYTLMSYAWIPSNIFTGFIFATYTFDFDECLEVYSHYNNGNSLLQSYINNGNFHEFNIGARVYVKPFKGLRLEAGCANVLSKRTGLVNKSISAFTAIMSAQYDIKNFYFSGKIFCPNRYFSTQNANVTKLPFNYRLLAGWSNGAVNVQVEANCPFNNKWITERSHSELPLYSRYATHKGDFTYRNISVTLTYTFDYGKPVMHENELGRQQDAQSAIMK